jgi:hypothetical protein
LEEVGEVAFEEVDGQEGLVPPEGPILEEAESSEQEAEGQKEEESASGGSGRREGGSEVDHRRPGGRVERSMRTTSPLVRRGLACGPAIDEAAVVVGGVDADGGFVDEGDGNGEASLEGAELFEAFGAFEGGRGQGGQLEQGGATVGVEAEVEQAEGGIGRRPVAMEGDRRAGEVESVAEGVGDDFDARRILEEGGVVDGGCEG